MGGFPQVLKQFSVESGETVDLGTIDVTGDKRPEPMPTKAAETTAAAKTKVDAKPAAGATSPAAETATAAAANDDPITISGRVLDPAGNPLAGATVRLLRTYWDPEIEHKPLAETTSDDQGHFEIGYRKSQFNVDVKRHEQWREVRVAAFKQGYGCDLVRPAELAEGQQPELHLPLDDLAITGRLIDLEGRPLTGITVECGMVLAPRTGDLSAWLASIKRGDLTPYEHVRGLPPEGTGLTKRIVSDAEGRFRLTGVGRERAVELILTGPAVARTTVTAVAQAMDSLAQPGRPWQSPEGFVVLIGAGPKIPVVGANFELALEPTRVIEGVVRDAKTGEPLADVGVQSWQFAGSHNPGMRLIRTQSDDEGRFRLVGMRKGPGNRIIAIPTDDQPYLMREADVPDPPGLEPAHVDFQLHRGIWITGRVTDAGSAAPVPMAQVFYIPYKSNEFARVLPEFPAGQFGKAHGIYYYMDRYQTAADGSYRLVGLPGPAIVGVLTPGDDYWSGQGFGDVHGEVDEAGRSLTFYSPRVPEKIWPTAMKEIEPAEAADVAGLDFALDRGRQVEITTVDPAGEPVPGVSVDGVTTSQAPKQRIGLASVTAVGLAPSEERPVVLWHHEKKLGKVIRLRADQPDGKITVQLDPSATVKGRIVLGDEPVAGATIRFRIPSHDGRAHLLPIVRTGKDGRFELPEVPSGVPYMVEVFGEGIKNPTIATALSVEPGQAVDLGTNEMGTTIRASTGKGEVPKKPAFDAKDQPTTAEAESLLDDHGQNHLARRPAGGGAHVAAIVAKRVLAQGIADETGGVQLSLQDFNSKNPTGTLIARQDGFGIAWQRLDLEAKLIEASLTLAPEEPIRVRLVDLEGRPAAGVQLSVEGIINPQVESNERGRAVWYDRRVGDSPAAWLKPITADAEGRFEVTGVPAGFAVNLFIDGSERFAPQDLMLNTGEPEQRDPHDGSYRGPVKNAKPGEEILLVLERRPNGSKDKSRLPTPAGRCHELA